MQNGKNKIVVLGGGESGTGSAVLALKMGYEVFLSDIRPDGGFRIFAEAGNTP